MTEQETDPLLDGDVLRDEESGGTRATCASGVTGWVKGVISDFRHFINKGSVLDLAVGIVIGEAFSSVVTSFVSDIFSPILGLIITTKLSETFLVLVKGPNFPYKTRDEARKDGAVTWNYGNFTQLIINFTCISMCLFVVVRMSKSMRKKRISNNNTKECPLCYSEIDGRARKCAFCGALLEKVPSKVTSGNMAE